MNNLVSSYHDALRKLLERTSNPKLGLERVSLLLELVGYKQQKKIVQIVGTNGKGSTSAFTESLLLAHGKSVSLFTSPHLSSARERIRINGQMVSEEDFVNATNFVLDKAQLLQDEASFFECILAMFVWLSLEKNVSIMIVEAGLGGRLDATTALKAQVLGVTSIDFDHQNILGNTLPLIAYEKICAARGHSHVISVRQHTEVERVLCEQQQQIGFSLNYSEYADQPLGLYGPHQRKNAGLALKLVSAFDVDMDPHAVSQGLLNVNWPGRYEKVEVDGVPIIFDGAHNPAGIDALITMIKEDKNIKYPLFLVYGSLSGSNVEQKVGLMSGLNFDQIYLHVSQNPRREPADNLKKYFIQYGIHENKIHNFSCFEEVKNFAHLHQATIVVCGSLYTIGELRANILDVVADPIMPNF